MSTEWVGGEAVGQENRRAAGFDGWRSCEVSGAPRSRRGRGSGWSLLVLSFL